MITKEELKNKIGLSDKEASVYRAILGLGSGYSSTIAGEANIKRSTCYQTLESLHQKGLVLKYVKGKKFFFAPAPAKNVTAYLDDQTRQIQQRKKEFEKILPQLEIFYSKAPNKPRIYFYEDKNKVLDLVISSVKGKHHKVLGFISLDLMYDRLDTKFFKNLAQSAKVNQTRLELINYDHQSKNRHEANHKTDKFINKYFLSIPKESRPKIKTQVTKQKLHNLILIAQDKLYLIDISPENLPEYMGVLIINQDIADSIKLTFQSFWSILKS